MSILGLVPLIKDDTANINKELFAPRKLCLRKIINQSLTIIP